MLLIDFYLSKKKKKELPKLFDAWGNIHPKGLFRLLRPKLCLDMILVKSGPSDSVANSYLYKRPLDFKY